MPARPGVPLAQCSDAEFLSLLPWDRGTPWRELARQGDYLPLLEAWRQGLPDPHALEVPGYWTAWSWSALATDRTPPALTKLMVDSLPKKKPAQTRPAMHAPSPAAARRKSLQPHLAALARERAYEPAELLAALEWLLRHARTSTLGEIWPVWRGALTTLLERRDEWTVEAGLVAAEDVRLVLAGEVPWVAARLFPGLTGWDRLGQQGIRRLARTLVDRTDGDGTPHAELVPRLADWLAPFVRVTACGRLFGNVPWTEEQTRHLQGLIEQVAPLCRADGQLPFSRGLPGASAAMLSLACRLPELQPSSTARDYLSDLTPSPSRLPTRPRLAPPVQTSSSSQSDWAQLATMRTGWTAEADAFTVTHHQPLPQIELSARGRLLLQGPWGLDVSLGEFAVELAEEWSCVCWQSDADADYVELQMIGPDKLHIERMILLSRQDHFLLMADCVHGAPAGRLQLESRLPLAPGVTAVADGSTRELSLHLGRKVARCYPLALPSARVDSTPHEWSVDGSALRLRQLAQGTGFMAPVIIDWHPDRLKAPALWRTLTVTEAGQIVSGDVAAGYRLKVADHQLLVYRSLRPSRTARAVLGHHTANEMVVGKLDASGTLEPLLQVDE